VNVLILNPPVLKDIKYIREGRCEQRLSSFQYVMVPISLPSIAALLRENGYTVKIIDSMVENFSLNELINIIDEFSPKVIIYNVSTATYNNDKEVLKFIKSKLNIKPFFAGIGSHVSALSREVLNESELDAVIRWEPELIALNLCNAIKKGKDLKNIKGLSYKRNSSIKMNEDEKFIEPLDKLPFPARDLLKNEKYTLPVVNSPYTLLVPSRGCPHRCIYCTAPLYYGRKVRFRSVESVINEIKEIFYKYHIKYITMWSDTFTINKKFVIDISKAIIEEGLHEKIKWMCNGRVDTVDDEMLSWMAKSGCIGISYGVESGVQEILDNAKKNIKIEQIERAISLTNKYGIESLAHIIFGLPGETKDTIIKTIDFVKKIKPTYAQFYCAIPFPGTEFYKMAKEKNWLVTNNWDYFEINRAIVSTKLLNHKELNKLRRLAYIKFYFNFKYIFSRIKRIRSIKDLFINIKQAYNFFISWIWG